TRVRPSRAFGRVELLTVYAMLIVSIGLLMQGGLPYMVSMTTYPFYMATPQNDWAHVILPHIPLWLSPTTPAMADWFWTGMPSGAHIPWLEWTRPGLSWSAFTIALMAAMYCLSSLLSRGWIERQRLTFPLAEIPLAMVGGGEQPTLGSGMFSRPALCLGFGIAASVTLLQGLSRWFPSLPSLNTWWIPIGRYFAGMPLPWSVLSDLLFTFSFAMFGVICLLPLEITLSLWLFYALYNVQRVAWAALGGVPGAQNTGDASTFISAQETGAFIVLAAIVLRASGGEFAAGWRRARSRAAGSGYIPLGESAALIGLLAASAFLIWFAVQAGASWWAFALLLAAFYVTLLGAARVIAAAGVMFFWRSMSEQELLISTIGSRAFSSTSLVMSAYFGWIYMRDPMNLAMPQMMNAVKLLQSGRVRGGRFTWAAAIAIVIVILVGTASLLSLAYHRGASNLGDWPFTMWPRYAFQEATNSIHNPQGPDNSARLALFIGAGVMALLVMAHTWIGGWPVNPIGYAIGSTCHTVWTCALMAWILSSSVRRYGGLRLHQSLRLACLGLVLGQYLAEAVIGAVSVFMVPP
ncbi:MAG: DUF6785 family protein, partial [Armatimonadota bacterium]